MAGWVSIHRQMMESKSYFSEPFCRNMAWIDLILLANHDENYIIIRGIRVKILRGQTGYTSETLAKRWKWSRGKVLRFLLILQKDGQIVQQKNNVTTLISILNYSKYQNNGTANNTANRTTDGQQTVQQTDTNNNANTVNKKNTIVKLGKNNLKNGEYNKQLDGDNSQGKSIWSERVKRTVQGNQN